MLRILATAAVVAATAVPALALDRRVTIVNNTGVTMTNFYGSNTGTTDWQEDILGKDVLPSGYSVTVNFDDATGYCMFDFLAIFENGAEIVDNQINVCEIGSFTYN